LRDDPIRLDPAVRWLLGMVDSARTVTGLLRSWRDGDRAAADALMPLVYQELHRLAAECLRGERPGHTFRPTDLVSEAYLRLSATAQPDWNDRLHFFAIAARNMRQILVDHARQRLADKRGSGERPITFEDDVVSSSKPDELVALDAALEALAAFDERKARVIELHYFGGLTRDEIGELLEVHANTVSRDLKLGQAWIHRRLQGADPNEQPEP
jgi:RNA polymerase sigma-70 factor (ECF subfamily)